MKDTSRKILKWYDEHKRKLPWRETKNPYLIWISEIMLQQTRVDQGMEYYLRFVNRFPELKSLAMADEEEVLKYWQGLGYYSRARNLHFSAKCIWNELNGKFPQTYDEILTLKGVGSYTAAAIASISFGLPYAVIDGNVMRVISRLFGIEIPVNNSKGQNQIKQELDTIFVEDQPGTFNQAIMEFGALFCIPKNPNCEQCIFRNECIAFKKNCVSDLPNKLKSRPPKDYFIYYFVILNEMDGSVYLRKRKNNGIWKNLYDFPSYDTERKMNLKQVMGSDEFVELLRDQPYKISKAKILKHQLSHKNIFANFF
jgi:A/G-specific adenine glycosylase